VIPNAGTMALLRRLLFFKEGFDMATTLPSVWAFIEPIDIAKVYFHVTPRIDAGARIKKIRNCLELKITCRVKSRLVWSDILVHFEPRNFDGW
jgi:hypothetical protein